MSEGLSKLKEENANLLESDKMDSFCFISLISCSSFWRPAQASESHKNGERRETYFDLLLPVIELLPPLFGSYILLLPFVL